MGLAVLFMVLNILNPAASAPAPFIFFLPAGPAVLPVGAVVLPAGTGALLTAKVLLAAKSVAVKGAVLAGGAFAAAAAVTAAGQQQQDLEQQQQSYDYAIEDSYIASDAYATPVASYGEPAAAPVPAASYGV